MIKKKKINIKYFISWETIRYSLFKRWLFTLTTSKILKLITYVKELSNARFSILWMIPSVYAFF